MNEEMTMTPLMRQVLKWARDGEERVNALVYADSIVRCLRAGWLRLEGTLSEARLTMTEAGACALTAAEAGAIRTCEEA